jgi:hypothetical protein
MWLLRFLSSVLLQASRSQEKKNNKVPRLTKLTAGFGNTYHRPALKVGVLVSLLMRVQFVCSVFLSGFPNMSIVFVRES